MPNHINIVVTVNGPPDVIALFVSDARGCRRNYPVDSTAVCGDYFGRSEPFCFDALVPLPFGFPDRPYDPDGVEMERATWGVRRGAYEHGWTDFGPGRWHTEENPHREHLADSGLHCATYRFVCENKAPLTLFRTLSRSWPELTFIVSWGGEGPKRGSGWFRDGSSFGAMGSYPPCLELDSWRWENLFVHDVFVTNVLRGAANDVSKAAQPVEPTLRSTVPVPVKTIDVTKIQAKRDDIVFVGVAPHFSSAQIRAMHQGLSKAHRETGAVFITHRIGDISKPVHVPRDRLEELHGYLGDLLATVGDDRPLAVRLAPKSCASKIPKIDMIHRSGDAARAGVCLGGPYESDCNDPEDADDFDVFGYPKTSF